MHGRRIMCGLILPSALWLAPACKTSSSNKPSSTAAPSSTTGANLSGSGNQTNATTTSGGNGPGSTQVTPVGATRSQQPEQPAVLTLPPAKAGDGEVKVRVIAYVNNLPIFDSELREAVIPHLRELQNLPDAEAEKKFKEIQAQQMENLVDRELVVSKVTKILSNKNAPPKAMDELKREASRQYDQRIKEIKKEYKLVSEEQVRQFFVKSGMSLDNYRRNIERNFICQTYVHQMITGKLEHLQLSQIHDYYMRHQDEYAIKDHVKWQDIFLDASKFPDRAAARNSAVRVENELRSGADFAKCSAQLRQAGYNPLPDDSGVGEGPGEITPAELETAVFALSAGQVGGPVEVPGGFHIFKVIERTKAGVKPFEDPETQRDVTEKLKNLLYHKEYLRLIEDLKGESVIQILE